MKNEPSRMHSPMLLIDRYRYAWHLGRISSYAKLIHLLKLLRATINKPIVCQEAAYKTCHANTALQMPFPLQHQHIKPVSSTNSLIIIENPTAYPSINQSTVQRQICLIYNSSPTPKTSTTLNPSDSHTTKSSFQDNQVWTEKLVKSQQIFGKKSIRHFGMLIWLLEKLVVSQRQKRHLRAIEGLPRSSRIKCCR